MNTSIGLLSLLPGSGYDEILDTLLTSPIKQNRLERPSHIHGGDLLRLEHISRDGHDIVAHHASGRSLLTTTSRTLNVHPIFLPF